MKDQKGILFDTESVRGLLTCANCGTMSVPFPCEKCGSTEFSKTQTRRVVRRLKMHEDYGKPIWDEARFDPAGCLKVPYRGGRMGCETTHRHWPAYVKNDIGWVRESHWFQTRDAAGVHVCYKLPATDQAWACQCTGDPYALKYALYRNGKKVWRPGMFMFKWVCRLWVQFDTPIAQRLQEISEEDAVAEGVFGPPWSGAGWRQYPYESCHLETARESFQTRITAINGPKVWDENYWVWRYKFRRIAPPEGES